MQRSFVALGLILVVAGALFAGDEPWKWDPAKKKTPAVGDRYFSTEEVTEKAKIKFGLPGQPAQNQDQTQTIKTRLIHEVLKIADGKIVKEKITIERFLLTKADGSDDDKSLEGKIVVIETKGDKRSAHIVGDSEAVSAEGKAWVDTAFARDRNDEDDAIFPDKPTAADTEWTLDPKKSSGGVIPAEVEIDAEGSSATGKLTNVRVEDGVHMGHVELKIKIKIKTFPGTPVAWTEGGVLELTMSGETSLERDKLRKKNYKFDGKLKGKAEQEADEGKVALQIAMTMSQSVDEGDLPKGTGEEPKEEPKKEDPKKEEPPKKMGE